MIYTIPFGYPFARELVRGVIDIAGAQPEKIAQTKIYLPTRRSIRTLSDAFLDAAPGHVTLLPVMQALGDTDEDSLEAHHDADDPELPPSIAPLRRVLMLARLVLAQHQAPENEITFVQAYRLALSLSQFLTEAQIERIDPKQFHTIVGEDFARHWEQTLSFLKIVTERWPEILEAEKKLDPWDRRNRLLEREVTRLKQHPPDFPVFAAGSTGSVPATAALLGAIAELKNGYVVLPGFNRMLSLRDTTAVLHDPTHPQHGMVRLLDGLGMAPGDVLPWPGLPAPTKTQAARQSFIEAALLPADLTKDWLSMVKKTSKWGDVADSLHRIDCRTEQDEAVIIALILREALNDPKKKAALITADRPLARRVAAELSRWSIAIDDSAGQALATTPVGTYLLALAEMVAAGFAPVPLLAFLKHPLTEGEGDPIQFRQLARKLEESCLRGVRPARGLSSVQHLLDKAKASKELMEFWRNFVKAMQVFEKELTPQELIGAFIETAELFAGDDLWSGDAGAASYQLLGDFIRQSELLPALDTSDLAVLFGDMMSDIRIRPNYGRHPRLFIWGPLEARLQHVDRAVLGGLNEGSWPRNVMIDPWLNQGMRRQGGLPPLARLIGLSAHDFYQALGNPEVFITRARRTDSVPTQPSRWLLRMESLGKSFQVAQVTDGTDHYSHWADWLDQPVKVKPIERPRPRPGAKHRPKRLSVTGIETWSRNPYAIFVDKILKLRSLPELEEEPGAAERGTLIHAILSDYLSAGLPNFDEETHMAELRKLADRHFAEWTDRPGLIVFWRPAFDRMASRFLQEMRRRNGDIERIYCEEKAEIAIGNDGFILTARADRIDRLRDGTYCIIDYKTGRPPTAKQMDDGRAMQLPLEANLLQFGGFAKIPSGSSVSRMEYWGLKAKTLELIAAGADTNGIIKASYDRLITLIQKYSQDDAIYHVKVGGDPYKTYEHFARNQEWGLTTDREE